MNTTLSTKLAALALALAVNSVIMGGVALVFNARVQTLSDVSVASSVIGQVDRATA
jgi:hypothetical protein